MSFADTFLEKLDLIAKMLDEDEAREKAQREFDRQYLEYLTDQAALRRIESFNERQTNLFGGFMGGFMGWR